MRSQKGPSLIRCLSGCTIKAYLAPPSLGGKCLQDSLQVLHGHAAHREKATQGVYGRFTPCEKGVQVLHDRFTPCEKGVQVFHSPATHCERAVQVLHGHAAHCERAAQVLHTRITHCAGLRKGCTEVYAPSGDHSEHCSSSSLTVRPSVGWTIVGAISASGSRTKRRRCISGWGRVRRGVSRQVSA